MNEDQIKHMVNRFLSWKLPENFNPDGGISFKKNFNEHTAHPMKHEPSGTNLFDFGQATTMVRHMAEGVQFDAFAWLIEAPGQHYLGVRALTNHHDFTWTQDHNAAIQFKSREQADLVLTALRCMDRKLFGFDETLGPARAVEHGWMAA